MIQCSIAEQQVPNFVLLKWLDLYRSAAPWLKALELLYNMFTLHLYAVKCLALEVL